MKASFENGHLVLSDEKEQIEYIIKHNNVEYFEANRKSEYFTLYLCNGDNNICIGIDDCESSKNFKEVLSIVRDWYYNYERRLLGEC